jgi:DNA invertase Pin-like site-specific DNA recombinase
MSKGHSIRAVAYYRMSDGRQEQSIPEQREEVKAYALREGYTILREYLDEAISGDDTERRTGFQNMLADARERGDFQAVLCWDQDRFGRFDPLEAGYWIKPLRDAGIHLATVAQGRIDWEDFAGRILYTVQQEGKHAFLRDLSRNTLRGSLAAARRGEWCGGKVPYAYRVEAKRLVPGDPSQVEVVRWLFRAYAHHGETLGSLARDLNRRGVPGPGGKMWHKTSVQKILDCPHYAGDFVWNRRRDGKYHTVRGGEITRERKAGGRQLKPRADWVLIRDAHEPLIDRATWDLVQLRRAENRQRKTPHERGGDFLFPQLLFCMDSGKPHPMHGCTCTSPRRGNRRQVLGPQKHRYRRYICGKYNSHGKAGCRCNTVAERQLADVVVRKLQEEFLDPGNLALLREEILRQLRAPGEADPGLVAGLRASLADLGRKIESGSEGYLEAPKHLRPALAAKLDEWTRRRDALLSQLQQIERQAAPADCEAVADSTLAQLATLRDRLDMADPPALRAVFREMVSRVELWFNHVPYGKHRNGGSRERSVVRRGLIHLRPDLLINREVPSERPLTTVTPARARPAASRAATRRP